MISTDRCEFNKETGQLSLQSRHLPERSFPRSLEIMSHHTGRIMKFLPITPDHPSYDEDGWDGELALYTPTEPCKVSILALYHGQ